MEVCVGVRAYTDKADEKEAECKVWGGKQRSERRVSELGVLELEVGMTCAVR